MSHRDLTPEEQEADGWTAEDLWQMLNAGGAVEVARRPPRRPVAARRVFVSRREDCDEGVGLLVEWKTSTDEFFVVSPSRHTTAA